MASIAECYLTGNRIARSFSSSHLPLHQQDLALSDLKLGD
jgi:hypothetical protein